MSPKQVKKMAVLGSLMASAWAAALSPNDTLVIQTSSDIPTLDPGVTYDAASGQVVENIYDTLLTYQGADFRKFTNRLATAWSVSADGKTYTFTLRKNVKFHSGNPLSCADVRYSFQRNLVTNSGQSGNWFIAESLLGTPENPADDPTITWARITKAVSCNAAGQVVFRLPAVDPAFMSKLAFVGQSIVDSKWAVKLGEWSGTEKDWKKWAGKNVSEGQLSKKPSGTGAYRLVRQDANTLLLKAFDGYWGKRGNIKQVIISYAPEFASRQQAFLRGDADVIDGEERSVDQLAFQGKPGVSWIDDLPNVAAPVIFMNGAIKDPAVLGSGQLDGQGIPANFFADVNVRRAFSYAFGYRTYLDEVQAGKGTYRTMLLPESFPGYDLKLPTYTYNPEKATSAFKNAWNGQVWALGFTFTANYNDKDKNSQVIMEILKKNIEALNPKFRVNLVPKQFSELLADNKKGKLALATGAWTPDYADPDNFMYTFYASDGYYFPRTSWKNARVDAWLKQARTTNSASERARLYSQVGRVAYDEAPYIVVPAAANYLFFRSNLTGVTKATYNPLVSFGLGVYWKDLNKK